MITSTGHVGWNLISGFTLSRFPIYGKSSVKRGTGTSKKEKGGKKVTNNRDPVLLITHPLTRSYSVLGM